MSNSSSVILAILLSVGLALGVSASDALSPSPPETKTVPRLEYTTSWLGNSLPGSHGWVLQAVDDIFVALDGTVYTNVPWDEHGGNVTAFKDGRFVAEARVGNHGGGFSITAKDDYVFFGGNQHRKGKPGIDRRNRADIFDKPKNVHVDCGIVHGLVVHDGKVFASVPAENRIKVFDVNLAPVGGWEVKDPGELAFDNEGALWVVQPSLKKITSYDAGTARPVGEVRLAPDIIPTDICFDNEGRMLVADEGVHQQIHAFKKVGGAFLADDRIGVEGGVFAGPVPGTNGPMRFYRPTGIGCDADGNLYVANRSDVNNNGATCIQCYFPQGDLLWELSASLWIDCDDVDPFDMNVLYGGGEKFIMDYSTGRGEEATLTAYTANPFAFPEDARIGGHGEHGQRGATWMRSIRGRKFMFLTSMSGLPICIYRFDPEKHGEVAIPCGRVGDSEIWIDGNGDGRRDTGEVEAIDVDGGMGAWVDSEGTIWHCGRKGFDRIRVKEINAIGAPVFSDASMENFPLPEPFTELRRIRFYPERNDMLILNGFTEEYPDIDHHWKRAGKVFRRYDNWGPDRWNLNWELIPPFEDRKTGNFGDGNVQALSVAGNYLFLAPNGSSKAMGVLRGHIDVYDLDTTEKIGWMEPDPWIQNGNPNGGDSNVGILDINDGMNAIRRSNGEYLIFWEDDMNSKNLMYRWRPE